jgi:hypothetical protein
LVVVLLLLLLLLLLLVVVAAAVGGEDSPWCECLLLFCGGQSSLLGEDRPPLPRRPRAMVLGLLFFCLVLCLCCEKRDERNEKQSMMM